MPDKIFFALFIGKRIFRVGVTDNKSVLIRALIVGLIILVLATTIPKVGGLVGLVCLLFGLGAFAISKRQTYLEAKEKNLL